MNKKEDNPCYGCLIRTVGCHSSCKLHKDYLDDYKKRKTAIKRYFLSDTSYRDYSSDKVARLQKLKNVNKKQRGL